jgi:hypothetical protein
MFTLRLPTEAADTAGAARVLGQCCQLVCHRFQELRAALGQQRLGG